MPLKTCPKCKKGCGPRLKVCKCGHVFEGTKATGRRRRGTKGSSHAHPLVPEPGAWVLDSYHGLPELSCPESLPPGKLDAETLKEQVQYEGLGFCIYHLVPPERVKDPKLQKLWKEAGDAMRGVINYLYD